VSVVASAIVQKAIIPTENDVTIAYLPLAHIMELLVETACLSQGAALGYGHPRTLTCKSPIYVSKNYYVCVLILRDCLCLSLPSAMTTPAHSLECTRVSLLLYYVF